MRKTKTSIKMKWPIPTAASGCGPKTPTIMVSTIPTVVCSKAETTMGQER
ncbi:MAG: hypothetical protein DDT24_00889 [Chloroflexi bacterium]|nr:hypothetical protein [Chloroflexota bacterium]